MTLLGKFRQGLRKTRQLLGRPIAEILRGEDRGAVFAELESALIGADVGVEAAKAVLADLQARDRAERLPDLTLALREDLLALLPAAPVEMATGHGPRVIFFVGVNGTGKTTTIGKLAARLQAEGARPLVAACDTFRAAAVEQLAAWAARSGVPIARQSPGADPAAVLHDALARAKERAESPVLVDTAGRLQAKVHLMDELAKMSRVAGRLVEGAPHESWLVLDATTGQNGLSQAREFTKASPLTGVVLTKLDGTAKGGIAFAIARELGLPIRLVGVGEGIDDLVPFDPEAYVDGLLGRVDEVPA